ncbi:hypothetical protein HY024_03605 [Candidatus Curtissbacteria bacterium]|nr:hypothetical protein [Candidatus Curtissbacteria bacterium]
MKILAQAWKSPEWLNVYMRLLLLTITLFGIGATAAIIWIVANIDPTASSPLVFIVFVGFLFCATLVDLAMLLYLMRTKLRGKQMIDRRWYLVTSLRMAFFVALFLALITTLAILKLVSLFNMVGVILVVSLFAVWMYLGKR